MQITTSYQPLSYSNQTLQSQYLKDADIGDKIQIKEKETQQAQASLPPIGAIARQTYGLSVLEEMSDVEYRAFLRATAEMTESEKIFAAQSLYRINEAYRAQFEKNKNPYQAGMSDFLTTFKNAYNEALSNDVRV